MENEQVKSEMTNVSPFTLLVNIITDPKAAFTQLKAHVNWVFPYLLSALTVITVVFLLADITAEFSRTMILDNEMIPEATKDQILEDMDNEDPNWTLLKGVGGGLISDGLMFLAVAFIMFMLVNFILGAKANFKTTFSMVAWIGVIGVIESFLKAALILQSGSIDVYTTSLAIFMDPAAKKSFIFQLMAQVELFMIWKAILYTIAINTLFNIEKQKATVAVVVLFIMGILTFAGAQTLARSFY